MKEAEKIICPTDIVCETQAMSILDCIRRAKSASGYQNAELKRLAFRRPYLTVATSFLRDTRPASLCQNARLMKFAFLNYRWASAAISNARSASLLSRGTRPASQSQNARAVSISQNVSSASLNLVPLRLTSRSCDTRLTFAL